MALISEDGLTFDTETKQAVRSYFGVTIDGYEHAIGLIGDDGNKLVEFAQRYGAKGMKEVEIKSTSDRSNDSFVFRVHFYS